MYSDYGFILTDKFETLERDATPYYRSFCEPNFSVSSCLPHRGGAGAGDLAQGAGAEW